MRSAVNGAALITVAVLLFTLLAVAWFETHAGPSAADFVSRQQALIQMLNTPMPVLGALTILLGMTSAFFDHTERVSQVLWLLGTFCLIGAGLVTRFGNQPINVKMMIWNANAVPPDWETLRDQWLHWHYLRTALSGAGLVSYVSGYFRGVKANQGG